MNEGLGCTVVDNAMKQTNKQKSEQKKASNRRMLIFLGVSISLLGIGGYLLLTYDPKSVAQKFYEDRKSAQYYQEYRESQSAEKKAERNIFLQD